MATVISKRIASVFLDAGAADEVLKRLAAEAQVWADKLKNAEQGSKDALTASKNLSQIRAQYQSIQKGIQDTNNEAGKTTAIFKDIARQFGPLGSLLAGGFAVGAVIALGKAIWDLKGEIIDLAIKEDELDKRSRAVFGEALPFITEEAKKNANQIGLTKREYIDYAASLQITYEALGFSKQRSAELSSENVKLAHGLKELSAGHLDFAAASDVLQKAVAGNVRGLTQLGIPIKRDKEEIAALSAQIQANEGVTKDQADTLALTRIIYDQVGEKVNALEKDESDLERQTERNTATLNEQKELIAQKLQPVILSISQAYSGLLSIFAGTEIEQATKAFGDQAEVMLSNTDRFIARMKHAAEVVSLGFFKFDSTKDQAASLADVNAKISLANGDLTQLVTYRQELLAKMNFAKAQDKTTDAANYAVQIKMLEDAYLEASKNMKANKVEAPIVGPSPQTLSEINTALADLKTKRDGILITDKAALASNQAQIDSLEAEKRSIEGNNKSYKERQTALKAVTDATQKASDDINNIGLVGMARDLAQNKEKFDALRKQAVEAGTDTARITELEKQGESNIRAKYAAENLLRIKQLDAEILGIRAKLSHDLGIQEQLDVSAITEKYQKEIDAAQGQADLIAKIEERRDIEIKQKMLELGAAEQKIQDDIDKKLIDERVSNAQNELATLRTKQEDELAEMELHGGDIAALLHRQASERVGLEGVLREAQRDAINRHYEDLYADTDAAGKSTEDLAREHGQAIVDLNAKFHQEDIDANDKANQLIIKSYDDRLKQVAQSVGDLFGSLQRLSDAGFDNKIRAVDDQIKKLQEAQTHVNTKEDKDRIQGQIDALGKQKDAISKQKDATKEFAIAQAIINTYLAGTVALAASPPPGNFIAAAAVVAAGIADVATIVAHDEGGPTDPNELSPRAQSRGSAKRSIISTTNPRLRTQDSGLPTPDSGLRTPDSANSRLKTSSATLSTTSSTDTITWYDDALGAMVSLSQPTTKRKNISTGGKVHQPTLGLFGEAGPEYVAPNWMYEHPTLVPVFDHLEAIRQSGAVPNAFASGGTTSTIPVKKQKNPGVAGPEDDPHWTTDPQLLAVLNLLVDQHNRLNAHLDNGIGVNLEKLKIGEDRASLIKRDNFLQQ